MVGRRGFLLGGAAALAAAACPGWSLRAAAPLEWPAFGDTLAIDAASGLHLGYFEPGDPQVAVELAAARDSGLGAVLQTMGPAGRFWLDDEAFERNLANLDQWDAILARHADTLLPVRQASDLQRAHATGRLGVIYGFQGTEPLGEDLERVGLFHQRGLRVIQLTHNRRNLVGDGCMEPGNAGLSRYGREVVEQLNGQRILVDVAHGSPRTIAEGIAASKAPVLISHTGCRALSDVPRNTSDENLRAMAERGGVAGIIFWPYLVEGAQPMAADVVRHIEHAINVCGEDHVGIGTDTGVAPIERGAQFERDNRELMKGMIADGIFPAHESPDIYTFIPDLNHVRRFETLGALLAARGHPEARISKILGGNFARVMAEVWG